MINAQRFQKLRIVRKDYKNQALRSSILLRAQQRQREQSMPMISDEKKSMVYLPSKNVFMFDIIDAQHKTWSIVSKMTSAAPARTIPMPAASR